MSIEDLAVKLVRQSSAYLSWLISEPARVEIVTKEQTADLSNPAHAVPQFP
jgi:hypothetical protein